MSNKSTRDKSKKYKLGRNDPCFCGSGIKYKRCCLPKGITTANPKAEYQENMDDEVVIKRNQFLQGKGIYISLPNSIVFQGKSYLAVGNKIMWDNNPNATFHELILRNLSLSLGEEWWNAEGQKSQDEKHYIRRCYDELKTLEGRDDLEAQIIDEHIRTLRATGNAQALMSLAFDVWLLSQKGYMRDEWLQRLRGRDAYQGVRYEIGVASLFVRIGCELEFYDSDRIEEDGKPPKRAEFVAVHPLTKNRVAVEAKSRHVEGVIHTPGTLNYSRALKGDITKLFKKALLKVVDGLPLIIFIDVNSPTEGGQAVQRTQWFSDVKRSFDSRPTPTNESPDKQAALFVTNFSSHYQGCSISHPGQHLFIGSVYSENPLVDGYFGEFMKMLLRAVGNYGYVPPSMDNLQVAVYETSNHLSKESFVENLRKLTAPQLGDSEYEKKQEESDNIIQMLVRDATQKSGGVWDPEIAEECFRQFKWLYTSGDQ